MMMSLKKSVSVVAVVVLVLGVTVCPERATATAGGESLNTAIDEMVRESLSSKSHFSKKKYERFWRDK